MKKFYRILSVALVFVMCLSMAPVSAQAEEETILVGEELLSLVEDAVTEAEVLEETAEPEETKPLESEVPEETAAPEATEMPVDTTEGESTAVSVSNSDEDVIVNSGTCGDDLTWTLSSDGVLTISGTGTMYQYIFEEVCAPWHSYREMIKHVVIETGVASIGNSAFYNCKNLTRVEISDSVTVIPPSAFDHCDNLTEINVSSKNKLFSDIDGVLYNKDASVLLCYPDGGDSVFNIPESVVIIGDYAFEFCNGLTSVRIPSNVTNIGNYAFYGCKSLIKIDIPDSVVSIGTCAFSHCYDLTSVIFGKNVTTIGAWSFSNCEELVYITIPDSVTTIEGYAFSHCSKLESVMLPDGVTTIGGRAFESCANLITVTIPDSVTIIENGVFLNCKGLTSVTIPDSVTTIGKGAFRGCTSLANVTIPDSVTIIENGVFLNCESLTSVTIPEGVTTITERTFYGCASLTNVSIPDGVTTIGEIAFYDCTSLTNVTIPDSVTTIGESAFEGCTSLTNVTIPDGVSSIGKRTFFGCASLTKVIIPDSVTIIEDSVFFSCHKLYSVSIPDSVKYIRESAFYDCGKLIDVYYRGSKTQWNAIIIGSYNNNLTNATIHYNSYDASDVGNLDSGEFTIIVKQNKKANHKDGSNYVLSSGATVFVGDTGYVTDVTGKVTIPWPVELVTVAKDDYCSLDVSAAALRASNTVYLEKETTSGKPVIQALWLKDYLGYEHDILHEEYTIDALNEDTYTLCAAVDWSESEQSVIRLHQNGIIADFTNGSLSVQLCSKFDITKPIEIVAVNVDGESVRKEFQLTAASALPMDGFTFDLGDSLSFTLPEEAGLFAGMKLSVGIYTPVPVVVQNENGKVYAAIGYREGLERDNEKKRLTPKDWSESIKELTEVRSDANESIRKYKDFMRKNESFIAKSEGSFGADGGFCVMAYAEGYIDACGEFNLTSSGGIIVFTSEVSYTQPVMFGPVPAFFEVAFSNEFETQMNLYLAEEIRAFTPRMTIVNETALSGGVGIGLAKVVSVSGGLEGALTNTLRFNKGLEYYQLKAALKWYAKFKLGPKQLKFDDTIKDAVWYEYPSATATAAVLYSSGGNGRSGIYDTSQYTPIDLSYLENASDSGADGKVVAPVLYSSGTDGAFVSNAYKDADPQVVYLPDGTALAVWIGYNSEVGSYDGLNLYYAYHDGGSWSAPALVDTDGTMDDTPYLTVIEEKAYLIWQDANGKITADMALEEIAPLMGISAAVFDINNLSFVVSALDAGGSLNTLPMLCGEDGVIYAVWMQNNASDWFGMDGSNSILCSSYADGEWTSPETLYSGLGPVLDLAADYSGGLQVAYSMDSDGDLNTETDVEVFENGSAVTENEYLDSGVVYSGGELYWFGAGTLMCGGSKAQADDSYITSDRFQIVNENGVKALLYTDSDGLASVLYGVFYDGGSGLWGSPITLMADGTHIPYFHASVNSNGELSILLEKQSVVGDYTSDDPYGTAELVWYNEPLTCNLTVSDLYFDNSTYVAGSDMVLRAMVSNVGELTVDTLHIAITDSEGNILSEKTVPETIRPGESAEIYSAFNPDEIEQDKALTLTISPVNLEDAAPDDNAVEATLGWNDLAVEAIQWAMDDSGMAIIHANIVNRGYDVQTDVVVKLYADSKNGDAIQTETIAELTSFGLVGVSFEVECVDEKVYYVCVERADSDLNYGNDYDFVVLRQSGSEGEDIQIESIVITTPDGTEIDKKALFLYPATFTDEEILDAMRAGDMSEAEAMAAWNDDGSFTFSAIDTGEYKLVVYTTSDRIPYIQTVNTTEGIELDSVVMPKYGDITGDDAVDAQDLVRLMNLIVGKNVEIVELTTDPTGDGECDILDVVRLIRYLAGHDVQLNGYSIRKTK